MRRAKFNDLALGVRFRYLEGSEAFLGETFVKIWPNRVASWDDTKIDICWIGQGVFSASEDDTNLDFEVEVLG